MTLILSALLSDLINAAFEAFDGVMLWLLEGMLHVEQLMDSAASALITTSIISDVYQFIYLFAWGLLILKFLFKGFEIYILWRDGDADSSPQDMLLGSVEAAVVMLVFPFLYDVMADVTLWFSTGIIQRFGLTTDNTFPSLIIVPETMNILLIILVLVYVILLVILIIKLLQRGFELLILRLGIPIACLGLVDSDKGLFKGYIQIFYKAMFTSVIQVTLLSLSLRIMVTPALINIIIGITTITAAFATPMLMQQMLVAGGRSGGGLTQKMYSASMVAGNIRRMIGK